MDHSSNKINFLDVLITKTGTKLSTSVYVKPTDTHQYLHATSCHRSIYKTSIPYGQAVRLKLICSNETDLQEKLKGLETWLLERGYRSERVRPEIQRVNNVERNSLLIKKPKRIDDNLTLVLTFHPALCKVFEIIKTAHRHVLKSDLLSKVLPKPPRVAYQNAKSLKDKLVRSKLYLEDREHMKRGNFPCGNKLCHILKVLQLVCNIK